MADTALGHLTEHAVRRVEEDRNLEKENATSLNPQEVASLAKGHQERIQHATHMHVQVLIQNNSFEIFWIEPYFLTFHSKFKDNPHCINSLCIGESIKQPPRGEGKGGVWPIASWFRGPHKVSYAIVFCSLRS